MEQAKYTYPPSFELFEKGISFLPKEIIGKKYLRQLLDFVRSLPREFVLPHFGSYLLECPLTAVDNWADISLAFDALNTPLHDLSLLPKTWQSCPAWRQLSHFSKACIENNLFSENLNGVQNVIGLEFDVGSSSKDPHKPSIFVGTNKLNETSFSRVINTFGHFFEIPEASLILLQKCNDIPIKEGHISCLGFMLGRPGNACKFIIAGEKFDSQNLEKYLSKLDLLKHHPEMIPLLESLKPYLKGIRLSIDIVYNQLSPKIGVECLLIPPSNSEEEGRWRDSVEIVHAKCAIDKNKLLKCIEWNKHNLEFIGNSLDSPHYFLASARSVNHFKLIFTPGEKMRAKVYFQEIWGVIERECAPDLFQTISATSQLTP